MENFRQFRGTTKLEFSCDSERNVTIILGDNTYGKTTLLQAFNWCFYGKADFAQGALKRIQTAESKRAEIAEQVKERNLQINHYEARKEQLDSILRENQATTALQKKKEDIEKNFY